MEVFDAETAIIFLFTKTRDFNFHIGIGSVPFKNLEGISPRVSTIMPAFTVQIVTSKAD
jgi:hypothetical protein